jgi:hypothetical protein
MTSPKPFKSRMENGFFGNVPKKPRPFGIATEVMIEADINYDIVWIIYSTLFN